MKSKGGRGKTLIERNEAIRQLKAEGKTTAEIGRIFDISRGRVHQILFPKGVVHRKGLQNPKQSSTINIVE